MNGAVTSKVTYIEKKIILQVLVTSILNDNQVVLHALPYSIGPLLDCPSTSHCYLKFDIVISAATVITAKILDYDFSLALGTGFVVAKIVWL